MSRAIRLLPNVKGVAASPTLLHPLFEISQNENPQESESTHF